MPPREPRTEAGRLVLRELRVAPRKILLRAIERLEIAALGVDPEMLHEASWMLRTATGHDGGADGKTPGEALRADVAPVVEHLCRQAGLAAEDAGEGAADVQSLARRWGMSARSVLRYRDLGLVPRAVRHPRGWRLVFAAPVVVAFESMHADRLARGGRFRRMSDDERVHIRRRAAELADERRTGASRAARTIAAELGRSHEGVRRALLEQSPDAGVGTNAWSDRERRFVLRCHDRVAEPAAIADRLGRPSIAVRRMIDAGRLRRLQQLDLSAARVPAAPRPRIPVGAPGPRLLADLVAEMRSAGAADAAIEREATAHAALLVASAADRIAGLSAARIRGEVLDEAEAELLGASRYRAEALRGVLPVVLRGLEGRLDAPIESLPARDAAALLHAGLAAAGAEAARFDPTHGGRLSAAVLLAVDRAVAQERPASARGGGARRTFAGVRIPDWTRNVSPWQAFLEPDARVRVGLVALEASERALLEARFGFGEPPATLRHLAERFGIARPWIGRDVRRATRAAIAAARGRASTIPR
ncbi:MAG: hypothetical protein AAFX79_07845 [Planctomycetota bacterium]